MKKTFGLLILVAASGCGREMDIATQQKCTQLYNQLIYYHEYETGDIDTLKAKFIPIYTSWNHLKGSIPHSDLKSQVDGCMMLYPFILKVYEGMSFNFPPDLPKDISSESEILYSIELERERRREDRELWENECRHLYQSINNHYLRSLYQIAKRRGENEDVLRLLENLIKDPVVSNATAKPLGRLAGLNLNVGERALKQLIINSNQGIDPTSADAQSIVPEN